MSAAQVSQSTKKLQVLQKFSLHLLLFSVFKQKQNKLPFALQEKDNGGFFPQFWVVDMLSIDMLLPPLSLHWTLEFIARHSGALQMPGTPPITVSWMIRWDGRRFERQQATLPQHFIKPVTRVLFYTFERLVFPRQTQHDGHCGPV